MKTGDGYVMDIQISPQLKPIMTTEMIFHLELLQLTNDELANMIADKALENPLLEVHDSYSESRDPSFYHANNTSQFDILQPQQQESIVHYLSELIPLKMQLSEEKRRVLYYLMEHLDQHLFLQIDVKKVCEKFSITSEVVQESIELLQSLEPFGIACKNSLHFLEQQVKLDDLAPPYALLFLQHDLQAIAELNVPYLMKKYNCKKQQVLETIHYIKTLQPFPEMPTLQERPSYIIPDMEIYGMFGQWRVQLNNQILPKVMINENYITLMKAQSHMKDYLEQYFKDAMLLVEAMEERKKTLERIMRWLIQKQYRFLENGQVGKMIPLRLIDAANDLNLHESTISRAIRNKFVKTPFGTLLLKEFFPKGISIANSSKLTSDGIKQRIQQLIAEESTSNPLSDQQLVECLKKEQIQISRRTVAKYRESLLIPNSTKRAYL
jgi:RNA polymerase sigma-54 factor